MQRHFATLLPSALLVGAVAASLAPAGAQAAVLASTNNVNPQLAGPGVLPLDLSNAGGSQPQLTFNVAAPTNVIVSFDAECSVAGPGFNAYANIDIQVDAAPLGGGFVSILPTAGPDDAFCSTNGTPADDGRINPSRSVVTRVPAGVSAVRVLLNTVGGPGPSRIDDLSLIVSD